MQKKELRQFAIELKALLEKYELNLGVDIDGDLYGIHVNGFVAIEKNSDKTYMLNHYSLFLGAYDLKLFLE